MQHPYTVITASAGSGKTYALVQKIMIICLAKPQKYDAIKGILALTFTNKAANEMKKRLIEWLENFTKENYAENKDLIDIQKKLKTLGISVDIEELHRRAKNILNYILHHYSTLNISTIDKFNSKLVRSFSYELGLPHQFNLEIQSEPYLIEAVDKLLNEIGSDKKISDAFMDLVDYNFENDEKTNISQALYNKAKTYISDIHYNELKKNENFDWKTYEQVKERLRNTIENDKKEAEEIAKSAMDSIRNNGLEISDFAGGSKNSIALFFQNYLKFSVGERDKFPFPSNNETALSTYQKGASGSCKDKLSVECLVPELIEKREEIIRRYISRVKNEKILKELLPFKFNKEIQDQLQNIENENDLVLLSKFNVIINENLKNEPSDFLYEKIGTRFHHFFIDEFQDTSKMQWENLLPLKDNNIAQEGNSFTIVGDPKQSIYRFRGGDSEIMLDILNHKENSYPTAHIEKLQNNWRSAKHIVEFNNELYESIGENLMPEHKKLFAEDGKQTPVKSFPGRVRVNLTDYDTKSATFFENSARQMHQDIQQCVDLGFSLKDITIICRTAKEIREYSALLGQKEIIYHDKKQNIKTISEKGLTLGISYTLKALIEFLNWKLEPKNLPYFIRFIYYLNELGRIHLKDFTEEINALLSQKDIESALEKNYNLHLTPTLNLNLYNYIEYFVREFSVEGKETDFLLNFMESVYAFSQNTNARLKDFITYWNEEAQGISVQASDNIDAVKLMTIHAAKGLEFPIVLLPIQSANKDNDFTQWFDLDNGTALKSINISHFDKTLALYDPEIQEFNEINQYKNLIDRLCVWYVATTRAVEHLYLYLQKPSKTGKPTEIFDFIEKKLKTSPQENEFDLYPNTPENWKKVSKQESIKPNAMALASLSHQPKNIGNIKIATPSKHYQNTKEEVRIGILTHEILAQIKTKNDVKKVLSRYLLEGSITQEEGQDIQGKIYRIINDEKYSAYFEEGLHIITEKDIMLNNTLYRPDRLVETPTGWVIIDFKTGKEKPEHIAQVQNYQAILEKIGKKVMDIQIIYI